MRRSPAEEYLEATAPPAPSAVSRRAPPRVPDWAEQTEAEVLRQYQSVPEAEARSRQATNQRPDEDLLNAFRARFGRTTDAASASAGPSASRSARAPQETFMDPGGGGPERAPQEYAGGPGGGYNPYEGAPDATQTGPARGPGGAPQPEPAPEPAPLPFENVDEPVYDSTFQNRPVTVALPHPFNSSESIRATFGPNPRAGQIIKVIGLTFHPDKGGTAEQFQNAYIAVNNAYGRTLIGQGRRKYRY